MTISTYTDEDGRQVIRANRGSIQRFPGEAWQPYYLAETGSGWVRYPAGGGELADEGRRVLRVLRTFARD